MKKNRVNSITLILALQMFSVVYAWEVERPADDINIKERTENAYTNGEASVGIGVAIDDYDENAAYGGADYVALNVSMRANSRMGITYSWYWGSLSWISESELYYRSDMASVGDDVIVPIDIPQPPDVYYFAFRF